MQRGCEDKLPQLFFAPKGPCLGQIHEGGALPGVSAAFGKRDARSEKKLEKGSGQVHPATTELYQPVKAGVQTHNLKTRPRFELWITRQRDLGKAVLKPLFV